MIHSPVPDEELRDLLDAFAEGRLSVGNMSRLEEMARQDANVLRTFVQYIDMCARLEWDFSPHSLGDLLAEQETRPRVDVPPLAEPSPGEQDGFPESNLKTPVLGNETSGTTSWLGKSTLDSAQLNRWLEKAPVVMFSVLLVVFGCLLGLRLGREAPEKGTATVQPAPVPKYVATLYATFDASWQDSSIPTEPGSRLPLGTLRLREGLVEILFDSGAKVVLEGPALLKLQSPDAAMLEQGKLVAHVPPSAIGFTVSTPNAVVVDLGTSFGLLAEGSHGTEVHVLEGRVEFSPRIDSLEATHKTIQLSAGQGSRLESRGSGAGTSFQFRDVEKDKDFFARSLPSVDPYLRIPVDLTFGPDGHLYVTSAHPHASVLKYNGTTGSLLDLFVTTGPPAPQGLVFGPDGHLYTSHGPTHNVIRYDGDSGKRIDEFVPAGSGGLMEPRGLLFGPDGNLYVASDGTHSVLRYDGRTGAFMDAFVPAGSGGLDGVEGLCFAPNGDLYVCSVNNNTVLRFDGKSGGVVETFAPETTVPYPVGIAASPTGVLFVTSMNTHRVLRFDSATGEFLGKCDLARRANPRRPHRITFGPDGNIYVVSHDSEDVLRYDGTTGEWIDSFLSSRRGVRRRAP